MNRFTNNKHYNYFIHEEDEHFYHPDIKGQPEFAGKVGEILRKRKHKRGIKQYLKTDPKAANIVDFLKNKSSINKRPVEKDINEAHMTKRDKEKEKQLKDKYDDSAMKQKFIDEYGEELGKRYYFATIRKQAMKEDLESGEAVLDEAKLSRGERRKRNIKKDQQRTRGGPRYDPQGIPLLRGKEHVDDWDRVVGKAPLATIGIVNRNTGEVEGRLTDTQHYKHHQEGRLKPHQTYSYTQFDDPDLVARGGTNPSIIKQMKKHIRRGKRVSILTARGRSAIPGIQKALQNSGINPRRVKIHGTGDMPRNISTPERKKIVLKHILKRSPAGVNFKDDWPDNAKAAQEIPGVSSFIAQPNDRGRVMPKPYRDQTPRSARKINADFELWLNDLLNEGYDLSNYNVDDLCKIYVDELLEEYEINESIFESPYAGILNGRSFNDQESEEELSPYEYWKNFINEDDVELDEEYEDEQELEENYVPTSYDIWKDYLNEKYINENQQEDPAAATPNPVEIARQEQNTLRMNKYKDKVIKNLQRSIQSARQSAKDAEDLLSGRVNEG